MKYWFLMMTLKFSPSGRKQSPGGRRPCLPEQTCTDLLCSCPSLSTTCFRRGLGSNPSSSSDSSCSTGSAAKSAPSGLWGRLLFHRVHHFRVWSCESWTSNTYAQIATIASKTVSFPCVIFLCWRLFFMVFRWYFMVFVKLMMKFTYSSMEFDKAL